MKFKDKISHTPPEIFIILIIILSFRLFSTIFYSLVNSDEGIIVLMLHYFKLPGDLYFWGQDRYGAIIPLLGQIPFRFFSLSSLVSESITHYIILISGFLALSTFIKSRASRIIFAVIWFLPPLYFTDLLRNVFGLQYSITGILFFIIYRYLPGYPSRTFFSKLPLYLLLLVLSIILFWVSELAVTSFLAILIVFIFYLFKERKVKVIFRKPETYLLISGLIIIYFAISWLKSLVETVPFDKYGEKFINDLPAILTSFNLFLSSIGSILAFQNPDFLFSIYSYFILVIALLFIVNKKKIRMEKKEVRWAVVFILDGAILVAVILISNWALINGMPRRYFVGAHISFWLAFLILFSNFNPGRVKNIITALAFVAAGVGAVSTIYSYRYIEPKSLKPKAELASEFTQLGKTGIISNYWNSYSSSFAEPDMIKATPYELSYSVRNFKLVDSVFAQPRIILIKDMWMDDFPDSLTQFDCTLIRKDSSFFIGGCRVNEYTIKRNWMFKAEDLKHPAEIAAFDKSSGRDVLQIGPGHETWIYKYLVHGPYMTLLKGNYEVSFDIRFDSVFTKDKYIALLEVVSDFGNVKLASRPLSYAMIPSLNNFHEYNLEFRLGKKNQNVEFRIYYLGGAFLTFDRLRLKQVAD